MTHTVELLAPAGNFEKLKTVLLYGADAVYLGGKAFNLRAGSSNFSMESLEQAVTYTHSKGKRVYVTLNIIAHNRDLKGLPKFIQFLQQIGVDAVIAADIGVMGLVQEHSDLPIHVSTQASTANWQTARQFHKLGAKRVVLARELSLDEIKAIKDKVPELELEVFVHGAMCMTYSGRCNMSSYMSQRDSNHGMCANSCRWKYAVVEEKRPGVYYPVYEDETGSYMYNSKDLCTIEFLDKIVAAGVSGLKIEGRNRGIFYGGATTKVYREALDEVISGQSSGHPYSMKPEWLQTLKSYNHRGYTSGFFLGKLDRDSERMDGKIDENYVLAGVVHDEIEEGVYKITARNKFLAGSNIEVLTLHGQNLSFKVEELLNEKGRLEEAAKPGFPYTLKASIKLDQNTILTVASPELDAEELEGDHSETNVN